MKQGTYIIISGQFPSEDSFRAPYILDQVKAIEKNSNYDVILLKPKKWYEKGTDYEYGNVKVYVFNTYNLPSYIFPKLFSGLSILSLLQKLKKIKVNVESIKFAHAHSTALGYFANALKKKNSKIKTMVQHHGFDVLNLEIGVLSKYKWYKEYIKRYSKNICNNIDLHLAVSNKTFDYLKSNKGIKIKEEFVLYNGVDLNKFYKKNNTKKTSNFAIGCVANFWPLKDQITLIKAVEKNIKNGVKDIKVIFIGSGETLATCKNYIEANNLNNFFHFKKELQHHELVDFYNSLDLFVLPSYHEAFGCVYTEAYACGIPFVGVKDQGISELIPEEDQSKWLIEKSDFNQLSKIIEDYKNSRYKQHLNIDLNIDTIINTFLCSIEK